MNVLLLPKTGDIGKIPYFLTTLNIIIKHIRNIVFKKVFTLTDRNSKHDFEHCFSKYS